MFVFAMLMRDLDICAESMPNPAFLGLASANDDERHDEFFPTDATARDARAFDFHDDVIFLSLDVERDCSFRAP